MTRLPFSPLLERAENMSDLARKLEVDRPTLYRYKERGLNLDVADKYAGRLGLLPCELWAEWFDVIEEARRERKLAQHREANRRYWASHPELKGDPQRLKYFRRHYRLNRARLIQQQKERDAQRLADPAERARVNARRRERYAATRAARNEGGLSGVSEVA